MLTCWVEKVSTFQKKGVWMLSTSKGERGALNFHIACYNTLHVTGIKTLVVVGYSIKGQIELGSTCDGFSLCYMTIAILHNHLKWRLGS